MKVAVMEDDATATDAGVVRRVVLSASATDRPPAGAAPLRVTVHVLLTPEASEAGAHIKEVTVNRGARLRETVLELPFSAAVTTAVWAEATVPAVALKEPMEAAAATVTLAGTVKLALLLVNATAAPPAGAGLLKAIVQTLVAGPVNAAGLQDRLLSFTPGAHIAIVELAVAPLAVAVTVPAQSLAIVPAVAEKLTVVAPAAAVTEAGAVKCASFDEMANGRPPAGAAPFKARVQVLLPPETREAGAHVKAVMVTPGARLRDAVLELPFSAAVTTAVWAEATVPAVALKVPAEAAAAIVTLGGTVKLALLLVKVTADPPVGAGLLKVTVQTLVAGPVTAAGLHAMALTVTVVVETETKPPVAAVVIAIAVGVAAEALVT